MTTRSASRPDKVGGSDELRQLRARIKQLENELRSARTGGGGSEPDRESRGLVVVLASALAAATALAAWLVALTFRRWARWFDE